MKGKIFDSVRKKYVALTPEEEVRQFLIKWLHEIKKVPFSLMSCEYPISRCGRSFRADIVVFSRKLSPMLIVECKAPTINLGEKAITQIAIYNTIMEVPYLIVTNGSESMIFKYDKEKGKYERTCRVPEYEEMENNA